MGLNTPLVYHIGTQQNSPVGLGLFLFLGSEFLEGPHLISLYNPSAQHGEQFMGGANAS